jgi:alpha-glucuronidase
MSTPLDPYRIALLPYLLGLTLAFGCSSEGGPDGPGAGGNAIGSGGNSAVGGNGQPGGGSVGTGSAAAVGGTGNGGGGSAVGGGSNPGGGNAPVGGGNSSSGGDTNGPYPKPDPVPADETGASLWLRYPKVPIQARLDEYQAGIKQVVKVGTGASLDAAEAELTQGLSGLFGASIASGPAADAGSVLVGTIADEPIKSLPLASRVTPLGAEGYLVEPAEVDGKAVIVVAANSQVGALYGSFALLRHLQSHRPLSGLALSGSPRIQHRVLNHWDNLDGSVERGYAGRSIWNWGALPGTVSPRYKDYARANASIGVNGAVLTNVNANAQVLNASNLAKVKVIADTLRPYGIRVYLTARFSAPSEIGGLSTADPKNASVKQWWVTKVNEIYTQIPDFGGFVVKANSEGQPGPQDYNATHADGANALAEALAPHDGIVMWRAFVYSSASPSDRIKQAYEEFKPLDGQFEPNAMVQVKNGPLDFQPREPFSPLFGAMPQTPLVLELQITKEYLGEDTHLAYLGPLFEEVLHADTHAKGDGSTVAKVIDGSLDDHEITAIAGVSNVGDDANWTGSHMNQANWYVFGRMAWDPDLSAEAVADEWVRQTFSNDPLVVGPVVQMMMSSREAVVNYMTPLGLAHIMGDDDHFGPEPWSNSFADHPEWNPVYYHKADTQGIGFNRTASGSNAVAQYSAPWNATFGDRATVPNEYLLFFHHAAWGDVLDSGRTVWEELVYRYSRGVDDVALMREAWSPIEGYIDAKRFKDVSDFLQIQHYEARWWRDACLSYFGTFSNQPIPSGYAPTANNLSFYQGLDSACPSNAAKPRCSQVYTGSPSPAILE